VETLDPFSEYLNRVERWRIEMERDQRTFVTLGNIRLAVVAVAGVMAWLAFRSGIISGWTLLLPLAVFIGLIVYHERVARRQQLARRAIGYYERGLARLDDKWAGTGNPGERFEDAAHIYSGDLDLFGKGSLFELISVARTAEGEQRLADWLTAPASAREVAERQSAVADLKRRVQLREDTALLGEDIRSGVHASALAAWGSAERVRFPSGARLIAAALSLWNLGAFSAFMAHMLSARALLAGIALTLLFALVLRKPALRVLEAVDTPAHDLQILALLLARLEQERFKSPRLQALRAALDIEGLPASRRISRLRRWMEFLDSTDHLVVRAIGPALLWREQVAMGIESWRQQTGPRVAGWIDAVAELEALSSFAALSFERPAWTIPELTPAGEIFFEAETLRHPLMNPGRCVPNDVKVGGGPRLLIVSGSNMSGKSTLLRAVGLNAVLAWAGGPVAAKRLRVAPVDVAASMRVVDSLQDGKSRFYAEITRLRKIVDLTGGDRPVLFLLDELLSGTNSHDRRIGAEAVVKTLIERGAAGFVTTHDLALTRIAAEMNGLAANVHFEDQLQDGRISFDYKMRPGVVARSNALELMRAVGLDV
jgi:hypothetical protein